MLALLFAVAAGLVGSFALMKRMLLAGDVISHLALPGFGLAFLLKINPLLGAATTLFLGTLLIWQLQKKTGLATESAIGVVFAAALGIGAAITPSDELIEALFGENHATSVLGTSGCFRSGFHHCRDLETARPTRVDSVLSGTGNGDWSKGRSRRPLLPLALQLDHTRGIALHGGTPGRFLDYPAGSHWTPSDQQDVPLSDCFVSRERRVGWGWVTAERYGSEIWCWTIDRHGSGFIVRDLPV